MTSPLRIADPRIERADSGEQEVSATIGEQRLWFRVPEDWDVRQSGEPFIIAGLLPAMRLGVPLEVDPAMPVSPVLLENLHHIQDVFRLWGPAMRQPFRIVPVRASAGAPAARNATTISFFSGGVDGCYTLLQARTQITHAVFSRGIDMQLANPVWDEAFRRNQAWLAGRGVPLVPVSTNARFVGHAFGIPWGTYFGSGLAAIGHVLGAGTVLVAAGHTWRELWPDGSHPLTDPWWSSESTTVVHHGRELKRWQKLERIAAEPGVLDLLRVCWQDQGYNCGKCEKCLRTMALLRILGLKSPAFPPLTSLRPLARLRPSDQSEACFVEEAFALAVDRGDTAAAAALQASLRRWQIRSLAGEIKRAVLGGRSRPVAPAGTP